MLQYCQHHLCAICKDIVRYGPLIRAYCLLQKHRIRTSHLEMICHWRRETMPLLLKQHNRSRGVSKTTVIQNVVTIQGSP